MKIDPSKASDQQFLRIDVDKLKQVDQLVHYRPRTTWLREIERDDFLVELIAPFKVCMPGPHVLPVRVDDRPEEVQLRVPGSVIFSMVKQRGATIEGVWRFQRRSHHPGSYLRVYDVSPWRAE